MNCLLRTYVSDENTSGTEDEIKIIHQQTNKTQLQYAAESATKALL